MSYSIVGEQILKFRKEKGLTQKELGEKTGVSSSAVSQWESGGTPDISLLPAISDVLGVTVDALFGRTGADRENMGTAVGGYVAALPEERRLGELLSLMKKAVISGYMGKIADVVDMEHYDLEETYLFRDGSITLVSVGGQSFLSAMHNAEGGFDDLLSCDGNICRLFSALSDPRALTMLVTLYRESPKYRTAGALALLTGLGQEEAGAILSQFTELDLAEELSLETEEGSVTAYKVNLNSSGIPLLVSARWMTEEREGGIRSVADNREPEPADEHE